MGLLRRSLLKEGERGRTERSSKLHDAEPLSFIIDPQYAHMQLCVSVCTRRGGLAKAPGED